MYAEMLWPAKLCQKLAPPLEGHKKARELPRAEHESTALQSKLPAHLSAPDPIRLTLNHFKSDPTTTLILFPLLFQIQLLKGKTRKT